METLAGSIMSLAGGDPALSAFLFLLTFGYWTPVPEELALVAIGFALKSAGLPYPEALAISIAALALSDSACYCFARFIGPRLLRLRPVERILRSERVKSAEAAFARKGPIFIFASRFVVGFRSAAALGSGFMRLNYFRFLLPSLSALLIGGPLWLGIGYFAGAKLGSKFAEAGKWLSAIGILAAAGVIAFIIGRIAARRLRTGASGPSPSPVEPSAAPLAPLHVLHELHPKAIGVEDVEELDHGVRLMGPGLDGDASGAQVGHEGIGGVDLEADGQALA